MPQNWPLCDAGNDVLNFQPADTMGYPILRQSTFRSTTTTTKVTTFESQYLSDM
jgi:hypothetical protein